ANGIALEYLSRVAEYENVTSRHPHAVIDARSFPITTGLDEPDPGVAAREVRHDRARVVGRVIVHHDQLHEIRVGALGKQVEYAPANAPALVAHHQDDGMTLMGCRLGASVAASG